MALNVNKLVVGDKLINNHSNNVQQVLSEPVFETRTDGPLKVTKDFLIEKESDYLQHNRKLNRR